MFKTFLFFFYFAEHFLKLARGLWFTSEPHKAYHVFYPFVEIA